MYESPVILCVAGNDDGTRFCGDPSVFGTCDAYCPPDYAYCVFVGVYYICSSAPWGSYCMPVTLFNSCTSYKA